jgi:hypothetical protein
MSPENCPACGNGNGHLQENGRLTLGGARQLGNPEDLRPANSGELLSGYLADGPKMEPTTENGIQVSSTKTNPRSARGWLAKGLQDNQQSLAVINDNIERMQRTRSSFLSHQRRLHHLGRLVDLVEGDAPLQAALADLLQAAMT